MEISKLPSTTAINSNTANATLDILSQLKQLGSIQATVASVTKDQVSLLTRLGEFTGSNTLGLKTGDTVQVRLDGDKQNPVLKVTPSQNKTTWLDANKFLKLLALLPANRPTPATVVGHQNNQTLIQLGSSQVSIPLQPLFKAGKLLSIVHHEKSTAIEVKQVDHQQVLRSALAQLISSRPQPSIDSPLQPMLKLVQSVLRVKAEKSSPANLISNKQSRVQNASANQVNALPKNTVSILATGLELLMRSLPKVSSLTPDSILKSIELVTHSNLIAKTEKGFSYSNFVSVLRQLSETEQGFSQLIQTLLKTNQEQADKVLQQLKKTIADNDEPLLTQFRDAIKSTEQSINQQLFQQTSLRFQQELQQPIAFNLTIPYTEQQTVKSLQLKIRQRKSEADAENQAWEIRLSFDFGLMGLISTHILLDGDTLSTSFWAIEEATKSKINNALPDFKHQLVKSGFNLGNFACYLGQPLQENDDLFSPLPNSLLDIKV